MNCFHALGCVFKFALRCRKIYRIGPRTKKNEKRISQRKYESLKEKINFKIIANKYCQIL